MKKILLTSTGLDNENIKNKFLELLNVKPKDAKILFIITAANDPDAIRVLPLCLDDLTNCGIKDENIKIYDMHKLIEKEELNNFDAIYVCGGSTEYLASRIKEIGFKDLVKDYMNQGGIYIGVSAGSICASKSCINGLELINNPIDVHCEIGNAVGVISNNEMITLSDEQAIYISDENVMVIE